MTNPIFGPEGFWIGITIGMGILAVSSMLMVASTDWSREARRALLCAVRTRTGEFVPISVAVPGSRGLGGERTSYYTSNRTLEELEDVDAMMNIL